MASGDSTSSAQTSTGGRVPGGPFDVFICFARPSGFIAAEALLAALPQGKISAFLDARSVSAGDRWHRVVRRAHRETKVTVVCVTAELEASVYALAEIDDAIDWAKPPHGRRVIVPWILPGAPPKTDWPPGLRAFQGVEGDAAAVVAVIAAPLGVALPSAPAGAPPVAPLLGIAPWAPRPSPVAPPVQVAPVAAPPAPPAADPAPSTEKPPWAAAAGADQYGRWADIDVKCVVQRMRWIAPGSFRMGSPADEPDRFDSDGPQHEVTLSQGYWLGDTPVTQALYLAVTGHNPSAFTSPPDLRRPVEQVSWDEAVAFTHRLAALRPSGAPDDGLVFQLPSEAEWEYACRAGTVAPTYAPAGKGLDDIAWTGSNAKGSTHRVGQLLANAWGLFDTLGNVWEWCADARRSWDEPYPGGPRVDPLGQAGPFRAFRGGSWAYVAQRARAAFRDASDPSRRDGRLGLRLSRGRAHQLPASSEP